MKQANPVGGANPAIVPIMPYSRASVNAQKGEIRRTFLQIAVYSFDQLQGQVRILHATAICPAAAMPFE